MQLVDVEVGGVDDQVGVGAQVGQQLRARGGCPSSRRPLALQRVRPAGRLLAADEHVVGGVEEQQRRTPADLVLGQVGLAATSKNDPDRTSTTTAIGWVGAAALVDQATTMVAAATGGRLSTT